MHAVECVVVNGVAALGFDQTEVNLVHRGKGLLLDDFEVRYLTSLKRIFYFFLSIDLFATVMLNDFTSLH